MSARREWESLIARARAWRLFFGATEGSAQALVLWGAALAAIFAAEFFSPSPPFFRRTLWSAAGAAAIAWGGRRAFRGLSAEALGRALGSGLRPPDRIVNLGQLLRTLPAEAESDPFIAREAAAFRQAAPALRPARSLMPAGWRAGLLKASSAVGAACLLAFLPIDGGRLAARRVLWPWSADEAWLALSPGDRRVPAGESVVLEAKPLLPGGKAPELFVKAEASRWERRTLEPAPEGGYRATLERVTEPLSYRARYRGLWTPTYRLTPYLPLRFESLRFRIVPPAYTGQPPEEMENAFSIRAPEGSLVEAAGRLDRPAVSARLTGPEGEVPVRGAPGREVSFQFRVRRSGTWLFRARSAEDDQTEAPLTAEAVPDAPPAAQIYSPEGEAFVSPRERLPVVYELSDDHGLASARLVVSLRDLPERSVPLPPDTGVREVVLVLTRMGLSPGDRAQAWIEAEDKNPAGPGRTRSAVFAFTVADRAADREQLLAELERWRSALLAAKTDEDLLAGKLSADQPPWGELSSRQRLAEQGVRELAESMENLTGRMEAADPWLAAEHRAAASALRDLLKEDLPEASRALSSMDKEAARGALGRVSSELERLAAASAEAETGSRARSLADRQSLEDTARELAQGLEKGLTPDLQQAMREIADELREIARVLQQSPGLLPEVPPGEDPVKVLKMEDMMRDLAEASRAAQAGDAQGAAAAARRLLEKVRALRQILSQAGERHSAEGGLSVQASGQAQRLMEKTKELITRQEELKARAGGVWDGAYLRLREEQERLLRSTSPVTLPETPSLSEGDKSLLASQAAEQDALGAETGALSQEVVTLSKKTARVGPAQRRRFEAAARAMEAASHALKGSLPPEALAAQEEALRQLRQVGDSLSSASGGGGSASGGGVGAGGGLLRGGASPAGRSPAGPTRLPRAEDFRPPREFREDVLRALEEKYPSRDKGVIEDYFKRWKK